MMSFNDAVLLVESGIYNKDLNPKFWYNKKFDQGVRQKLLNIVNDFTAENTFIIDDIQLTGSLANYNYNKYSDLDVHILLDFSNINDDTDLVKQALDGKRFVWNLRHNIIIRDHEVELYYQDTNEPHIASGLYSILKDEWLVEPTYDPPSVDMNDVKKKANSIIDDIHRLKDEVQQNKSSKHAKVLYKFGKRVKSKLGKMRTEGLNRDGEFSIENLAFKQLRNDGSIGLLIDLITKSYEQIYNESTVEEEIDDSSFSNFFDTTNKKGPRQQKGFTGGGRLHQNMLPDMHKTDPELNSKVEILRERPGKLVLSQADVNYCKDKYKVDVDANLTRDEPKQLGTSGIVLYYDPKLNAFVIEKS